MKQESASPLPITKRRALAAADQLELQVSSDLGVDRIGEIIDLSDKGVVARFPRDQAPVFAIEDELELVFRWFRKNYDALNIQAQVITRTDDSESLRYEFTFLEEPGRGHAVLSNLFNRRSAYRATPRPDEEIDLQLWVHREVPRKALLVSTMKNISVLGIGMTTPAGEDVILKDHTLIDMSFKLPGFSEVNTVTARIIARELRGDTIHYGLQFGRLLTRQWDSVEDTVAEYVRQREQEELGR